MTVPSWMVKVLGALAVLGDIGAFLARYTQENPAPLAKAEWFTYGTGLLIGVALILSKQFNVSNSPIPKAATVVSPENEAKANPAAEKGGG